MMYLMILDYFNSRIIIRLVNTDTDVRKYISDNFGLRQSNSAYLTSNILVIDGELL